MKPRLRLYEYLLVPVVVIIFAIFAVVTYVFGHLPENREEE